MDMGKLEPNCRWLALRRKWLTAASRGSPLVLIDREGRGGGDDGGDRQSSATNWKERDAIAVECGDVASGDRGHDKGWGWSENIRCGGRSQSG